MKLGIMSDSHGRVGHVRTALRMLDDAGAEAVAHCGDVGGLPVLDELAGRRCWFVWGNTDVPEPTWRSYVKGLGLTWPEGPVELTLAGRRIGIYHGHEKGFAEAVRKTPYDYLLHGHTHRLNDGRVAGMRVINPGALHRVAIRTVAVLDLATDELEFLELDAASSPFQP